jgi:RNA polymerase sigma factor (sigma-70 family)
MNTHRLATAELVRLFDGGSLSGLSEWELLEQFLACRDELAFQVLVSRHGPMVLGICRRMLANAADVEDAFQATFLVLLRRAGSLGPGDAIAAWLHGVAVRVAQQARNAAARRSRRERLGMTVEATAVESSSEDSELRQILDQEISRLPLKYRAPIVLCYLEGQTHEEAARRLRWPLGTVKGRLARARSLLESRLTRRGVACGTGLSALAACSGTEAAVPISLLAATCNAAARISSGTLIANVVSTSIAQLIQGVLSTMILQKLKLIAVAFVVSSLLLTGVGVVARQPGTRPRELHGLDARKIQRDPKGPTPLIAATVTEVAEKTVPPRPRDEQDLYRELIQGAGRAFLASEADFLKGSSSLDRAYHASRLLMESERDAASAPAEKLKAVEHHFERMQKLARGFAEEGNAADANGAEARAYLAEAELLLAQAKTQKQAPAAQPAQAGKSDGPGKDPRSKAILAKLEEPIAMSFANETPLEDLLKYIKQATSSPNGSGIPIYVDPLGMQEAEKTMTSTVQHLDLEGIPLRRTLQLALQQLDLAYFVDDGILVITSQESEDQGLRPCTSPGPSPFMSKQDKAERGEMSIREMETFSEELKVRTQIMKQLRDLGKIDKIDQETDEGVRGRAVTIDQVAGLLKEMKALVDEVKAERENAKKDKSK